MVVKGRGLGGPMLKLANGTWNVTSLMGKEPELVREVERYQSDIVGLTSTHSLGFGTSLLWRTLFFVLELFQVRGGEQVSAY